jgi:hypothetical protein
MYIAALYALDLWQVATVEAEARARTQRLNEELQRLSSKSSDLEIELDTLRDALKVKPP